MHNTVAIPLKKNPTPKVSVYIRVGTEAQKKPKRKTKDIKEPASVKIGKTRYPLPEKLLKPIYDYKSRFHAYTILKERMASL